MTKNKGFRWRSFETDGKAIKFLVNSPDGGGGGAGHDDCGDGELYGGGGCGNCAVAIVALSLEWPVNCDSFQIAPSPKIRLPFHLSCWLRGWCWTVVAVEHL